MLCFLFSFTLVSEFLVGHTPIYVQNFYMYLKLQVSTCSCPKNEFKDTLYSFPSISVSSGNIIAIKLSGICFGFKWRLLSPSALAFLAHTRAATVDRNRHRKCIFLSFPNYADLSKGLFLSFSSRSNDQQHVKKIGRLIHSEITEMS